MKVLFTNQRVEVRVKKEGEEVVQAFNLAHEIDADASSYRVTRTKVEIKLKKAAAGLQWSDLESAEPVFKQKSAYASKKNWAEIEKQVKKEEEEEKPEGESLEYI